NDLAPPALARFLAAEALEKFEDRDTAQALTSGVLMWDGEPRVRAEYILAHMSAVAALPQLAWSSINAPIQAYRSAAFELLDRILRRDRRLDIQDLHVR